jgi:G protein-coupled receptor Mth (Methuselah protein)
MPFFLITIIVYVCLPELRNLHGKCLLCYVIGLAMRLLTYIIMHNNVHWPAENLPACKAAGYSYIFFSWISFLWLNVMGIDLLHAFNPNYHRNQSKKFLFYCLYAFGTSTLIVSLIIILNEFDLIPNDYQHTIGEHSCISGTGVIDHIFYTLAPVIYTFVFNFVLLIITGHKIYSIKKGDTNRRQTTSHDPARYFLLI